MYCWYKDIDCPHCGEMKLFDIQTNEPFTVRLCYRENENKSCIFNNCNMLRGYITRMIEEHAQLFDRMVKLRDYIYGGPAEQKDDKIEFANKCLQLRGMRLYEEALLARLENAGIQFDGQHYANIVNNVDNIVHPKDCEVPLCKANPNNDPTDEE